MTETFGRFAAVPIGPLLSVKDSGLTLATTGAADLDRIARSDVVIDGGSAGVEFAVWGDDELQAVVGAIDGSAPLTEALGRSAGIGWDLSAGTLRVAGTTVKSGLPKVAKGDMVGMLFEFDHAPGVRLFRNGLQQHAQAIPLEGPLHFAASLAASRAGGLMLAVNAGQWAANSPAAATGWALRQAQVPAPRLADTDFLSAPGDTPANMRYEGVLAEGVTVMSALDFWAWGGSIRQAGVADCLVHDADGRLDALALSGGAGKPVSIHLGPAGGTLADMRTVGRFVIDRVEVVGDGGKRIVLLDAHADMDEPITRTVFLPNIPTLAWTVQPLVIGAVASVPALGANSDGSALFLADAPVSVDAVMDRGDLMEPGTFALAADSQQLLMRSPPVGPVVVDASSIGPAQQPATLRQALGDVFSRIGKAAWSGEDADAIDSMTGYAGVGYYSRNSVSARTAVAAILPSYGAGLFQAPDGILRIARVLAPESVATPMFELTADDLAEDLVALPDDAPNLTRRFAYRPNAQVLGAADLVTDVVGVPQAKRDQLTAPYRGQVYAAGPLHAHYRHADAAPPFITQFWRGEDAQAEADRIVGLYGVMRHFYVLTVRGDQFLEVQPGQVGRMTYPRYGLAAGKNVLVRSVERNPATGDVVLNVWG